MSDELQVDKAIRRLFDGYGNLLERVKALERDVERIKADIDYLLTRVGDISFRLDSVKSLYDMGKYKYDNCANKMEDGRCNAWIRKPTGERIKPDVFWCAVCHLYQPKGL